MTSAAGDQIAGRWPTLFEGRILAALEIGRVVLGTRSTIMRKLRILPTPGGSRLEMICPCPPMVHPRYLEVTDPRQGLIQPAVVTHHALVIARRIVGGKQRIAHPVNEHQFAATGGKRRKLNIKVMSPELGGAVPMFQA